MRRKSSKAKWLIPLALVLLLAAGAAAWLITPGVSRPRMAKGDVTLTVEADGSLLLSWPETEGTCRLSVRSGEGRDFDLVRECQGNEAELGQGFLDEPLEIRIQSAVRGKNLLGVERELLSREAIDVTVQPYSTLHPVLTGEGGEEPGELDLAWEGRGGYELGILENGAYRPLRSVEGNTAALRFSEDGDLPLPGYDAPVRLALRAVREGEGYVLYGPWSAPLEVEREVLLGSDLALDCQQTGERTYTLRWNEAKGDHYEVQEWSAAQSRWETLAEVPRDGELRYDTGMLRSGSDHRYRVVSVGGEEPVEPVETSLRAEISTRYATVWPVIQVECFEDAGLSKSAGKVPAGTALCVLEEEGDAFQVRFRDQYVWVDSRYCMIDLPEYVGDVCAYDITNSYSSIFMVHDNPIRDITGTVIQGFEGVSTAEDGFLVPYLYPCAKKLLRAAQAAERDGYRLRIYEAFRPNEATRALYDTTEAQLDYPVPVLDGESGEYIFYEPPAEPIVDPETGYLLDPETGLPILDEATGLPIMAQPEEGEPALPEDGMSEGEVQAPEGEAPLPEEGPAPETETEPQTEPASQTAPDAQAEPASQTEPDSQAEPASQTQSLGGFAWGTDPAPEADSGPEEDRPEVEFTGPTFREVMTDGRWRLGSFLAASVSAHNRGIALDLTIERRDGEPLEMQSAMHDLSWYSVTSRNNDNARLLESYMTMEGVAMRGLVSEWWHFQDDETREAIGLSAYLFKGVTAEGWTRDGVGWRYRDAQGNYARNTTLKIDGVRYTFDGDGYAAE